MFRFQNDLRPHEGQTSQGRLVLILCENVSQQAASDFVSRISNTNSHVKFIFFQIKKTDAFVSDEMENIVAILVRNRNIINNVIMFLENTTNILNIINTVSNTAELKYTVIHHVTEWMIVSRHFPKLTSGMQESAFQIDFISMICRDANNTISIVQKSRGGHFSVKARVLSNHIQKFISMQESYKTVEIYFKSLAAIKSIRKSGDLYLKSKKSVVAGLRIPVAMSSSELEDWNVRFKAKKIKNEETYALALLDYLAEYLNFTYNIVVPNDGGYYGIVTNGNATGATGQLARREACLATMPMAPISSRLTVMDFVPVPILSDSVHIIYRLPQQADRVDLTYMKIFQPAFVYIHIAPVVFILLFIVGSRVLTQLCAQQHACVIGTWRRRNVLPLLRYVCFRESEENSWHFKRILVASWQVFFLVMWSSYSAYLVTSFVAKPQELTISSFKELDENKNFKVGLMSSSSATISALLTTSNVHTRALWRRLQKQNKTDQWTFSTNVSVHMQRIVAGGYVYLGGVHTLKDDNYVNSLVNHEDIRYYTTTDFSFRYTSYVGIATGVFYKEALLKSLHSLNENGVLERLKNQHLNADFVSLSHKRQVSEEHATVTFHRISLLLFLALGCVFLSFLILMCEYIIQRFNITFAP
ncbi:hypothetical protein BsWGS_23215 [Bradybaena similaris]